MKDSIALLPAILIGGQMNFGINICGNWSEGNLKSNKRLRLQVKNPGGLPLFKDSISGLEKVFRTDLYHRLAEAVIFLPSLAERPDDIPLLAQELLRQCNQAFKKRAELSQESLAFLQRLPWPGNIRELKNVIYRSVKLAKNEIIAPEDIKLDRFLSGGATPSLP